MDIEYLLGSEEVCSIPLAPYSEEAIAFLGRWAELLLASREVRAFPDVVTFAFWCRKANLLRLKEAAGLESSRLGRGLVFHIAPSNIPVNFAFSFAFGLLAGNANIVRIPSANFPQVQLLRDACRKALEEFPEIRRRTAWIRYPVNAETTAYFSRMADGRMIWGGDRTIASVLAGGGKPRSADVLFADRYSICLMDGNSVLRASDGELRSLAQNFYNDTWLMDQNACSSPMLILWLNGSAEAKTRFWEAANALAEEKYFLQPASAVDKYVQLCTEAANGLSVLRTVRMGNMTYRTELFALPEDLTVLRGKCGYFYEYDLSSLHELSPYITEKFQTAAYFGMNPKALQQWVLEDRLRGIDRIVPVGKAMDIQVIWDGYDIVRTLSRIVSAS